MSLKKIQDINFQNKNIFLRADFNAPIDAHGNIADNTRLEAILPTIRLLRESRSNILITSHFGQPKNGYEDRFSLVRIATALEEMLGERVGFIPLSDERILISPDIFHDTRIVLLENLRFYDGEKKNDSTYLHPIVEWADIYINDAFGVCHRAHASVSAVVDDFNQLDKPAVAGLLLQKEYEYLHEKIDTPERPFVAILGGSKVSSKLGAIKTLLERADTIILGGAMIFTFLKAMGKEIGKSLHETDLVDTAREILQKAKTLKKTILFPVDYIVSSDFSENEGIKIVDADGIPHDMMALDIGPRSIDAVARACVDAKTIFWNGPMGAYEMSSFAGGSIGVARILSHSDALTFAGGGDSLAIIKSSGYVRDFDFLSTGGGASLELIEGKNLPGIEKLLL